MNYCEQQLTFPSDSKLLIIHADDFGMCHSVNLAICAAFADRAISSASAMVPCPWFPEAAEFAASNADLDVGIHLTVTSEWSGYKWRPVAAPAPGLVDGSGYFWSSSDMIQVGREPLEQELLAQVSLARHQGLSPTHIDQHMFALASRQFITTYINVARKCRLPFFTDSYWYTFAPPLNDPSSVEPVVDTVLQADARSPVSSLEDYYLGILRDLRPGLNQLIVHPGLDDSELRSITRGERAFGSAWRQRDLDVISSSKFKHALERNNIIVTNWRLIGQAQSSQRHADRIQIVGLPFTVVPLEEP